MSIPDYQTFMLPLLQAIGDGREWSTRDLMRHLADRFELTEQERQERLPSGQQTIVGNRVGWAKTYLKNAGMLLNPARGKVLISERGRKILAENPLVINTQYLEQFPEYRDFRERSRLDEITNRLASESETAFETRTPLELIDSSFESLK